MRQTSSRFRLLVLVLAMHLAHVPVPVWDADDADLDARSATASRGRIAGLRCCWDLELLLLGIDPPEDLDEGPIDSESDSPHSELFSSNRLGWRPGLLKSGEVVPSAALIALPAHCGMISCSARLLDAHPSTCYSASFAGSHPWRTLLMVLTV